MTRPIVAVLSVAVALGVSIEAQNRSPTKAQIEAINQQFKDRIITAKLDLPSVRSVYVTPDGQYDEARYRERLAMQPLSIPRDDTAKLSKIEIKEDKIEVLINGGGMRPPKGKVLAVIGGRKRVGSRIEIEFRRPLTQADVTPEVIVRAVSRIISIEGMDASVALARPDELLAPIAKAPGAGVAPPGTLPATARPAAAVPAVPAVQVVSAEVRPTRLRAGDKLDLVVHYEVSGLADAAQTEVTEERQLVLDGKPLFSQAVSETVQRANGRHSSTFDFSVPASAKTGVYTFSVTVRLGAAAATREALFQITP